MTSKGIDISHWNRVIDFNQVKASGIDFVIIKAGGSDKGFYKDNKFEDYYRLARLAGMHIGAYYYAGPNFYGHKSGVLDAQRFLKIINGKSFEYPLYIDVEETSTSSKAQLNTSQAVLGFCDTLEESGFYAGVYSSDISGFKERLDIDMLSEVDKWVARYGKEPQYVQKFGMWQKSSTGNVPGIIGYVDIDVAYKNYPSIMRKRNLNNMRR